MNPTDNMGQCVFPVGEKVPGTLYRKDICREPTLLDKDGNYTPFCSEHTKEIQKIMAYKRQMNQKPTGSFRSKGGKKY